MGDLTCAWAPAAQGEDPLCDFCAAVAAVEKGTHLTPRFILDSTQDVSAETGAWMALLAGFQLACRHPRYSGPGRALAEKLARRIQEQITITREMQVILEMGWHEKLDRPASVMKSSGN